MLDFKVIKDLIRTIGDYILDSIIVSMLHNFECDNLVVI